MAEEEHSTPANLYRFAYSVVVQTIARLESLNDLSEMDGLVMRLEYLNRSLANLDSPDTDEIMLLIGEAISCMSRDRSLSLGSDGVNVPHMFEFFWICLSYLMRLFVCCMWAGNLLILSQQSN